MSASEDSNNVDGTKKKSGPRTAYDIQRTKLERLMKDPSKPVFIPEPRKDKDPNKAPDYVYNVMGSSAGAGSGEFHIYRHIRRKENMRQKVMGEQSEKVQLNEAYHQKLADNERLAEERTAKKRAKRQKKKMKRKKSGNKKQKEESSTSESEEDETEEEKKSAEQDNKSGEQETKQESATEQNKN